jgi:DNA-binding NarL/FixJ family response regulator
MSDKQVIILGARTLQNGLIAESIREQTGYATCVTPCLVEHHGEGDLRESCLETLLIFDWEGNGREPVCPCCGIRLTELAATAKLALINAPDEPDFESQAVAWGVRGAFPADISINQLVRGVRAVLGGELWFSRRTLSRSLIEMTRQSVRSSTQRTDAGLTEREREILLNIMNGLSNSDIAGQLYITESTVKSHVYRVFKKIGVQNRIQAALWALQHLT